VIGGSPVALARRRDFPYLKVMARPVSSQHEMMPQSRPWGGVGPVIAWAIVWVSAGLGGVALLGALALWFHYGTAVFFEMIASGVSACF
jgi:hypothetical protein